MNESSQPLPSLHPKRPFPQGRFTFAGRTRERRTGAEACHEPSRVSAGDGRLGRLGHVAADRVDDLGAVEQAGTLLG